ncbi:MAG: DNA topoisomerase IB [Acidimicrobiales bacterium]
MARLRRSDCSVPGIRRIKRGKTFSYAWADGARVCDAETLERIADLAVPPAWREVWISPWPHGHIQATGTDAAGRRQYRYHDEWRRKRDIEKFERMVLFGKSLPTLRARVSADLGPSGYPKDKILATAVRLLDIGYFRIGGEAYAEENDTFGLATMEREHVRVSGSEMFFDYPAKGGIRRRITITDAEVAPILFGLERRRGGGADLLAWKEKGRWVDLTADDVNAYLKHVIGEEFSAKDFRTWSATVLAAARLALAAQRGANGAGRRLVTAVCKEVSAQLGNTPAVCRSSYIDPRVFDRHATGDTIATAMKRASRLSSPITDQEIRAEMDAAVVALLEAGNGRDAMTQPSAPPRQPMPKRARASASSTSASSTSRSKPARSRALSTARSESRPRAA